MIEIVYFYIYDIIVKHYHKGEMIHVSAVHCKVYIV